MTTVSIYEDNDKLRNLLELMVNSSGTLVVVGSYSNGQQVAEQIRTDAPDVILMDIDMPGPTGIECVRFAKQTRVEVRILMHTVFDDDERLFASLCNGADGYLLKKDTSNQLIKALNEVADGGAPMSPGIARRVLQTFHQPPPNRQVYHISDRELQILRLVAQGYTYRQIGIECGISVETVRRHLKNIYQKLHVQCGPEAVAKALRERLI